MEKSRHLDGIKALFLAGSCEFDFWRSLLSSCGWLFVHEVIDTMAGNEIDELHFNSKSKISVLSFEELALRSGK